MHTATNTHKNQKITATDSAGRDPVGRDMKTLLLVQFRGSAEFGAVMDELQAKAGATDRCDLVDRALRLLAVSLGVTLPVRAMVKGTNRHGKPRWK